MPQNFLPQIKIPPDMIHLGIGQPSSSLLPLKEMEQAAAHCLSKKNSFFLAYGEAQGNEAFRQTLAQFLTSQYPNSVSARDLFITNGNSQALDFICTLFTNPGDTVLVEEPSYYLALKIFADRRLNIVSIPVDEKGIDTDLLQQKLETLKPAFLYTIPVYHNPSGVTLSMKRRKQLVQISAHNNLLVIADEVYHFLNYLDDPPLPMGTWKDQCPVISLGSFSKILAPGLRLGWIQTNQDMAKKMSKSGLVVSGGGLNPFVSEIVNSFITLGTLKTNIKTLKDIYHKRLETFYDRLGQDLPENAVFHKPKGGYFIWVKLPGPIDTKLLRPTARKHHVDFMPGHMFSNTDRLKNYMRLSFAFYDEKELEQGSKRLGQVITNQFHCI